MLQQRYALPSYALPSQQRYALLSCHDKTNLTAFATQLLDTGRRLIATGGTYVELASSLPRDAVENGLLLKVSDITGFPEILGGRVKTLHPKIHGGLLTDWDNAEHVREAAEHGIPHIDVVVVNLYPFWEVEANVTTPEEATELIDIGGVAMIRAAAKNHKHIAVYTSSTQYGEYTSPTQYGEYTSSTQSPRNRRLALAAFEVTARYDRMIADYFQDSRSSTTRREYTLVAPMKYGCNPHQAPAGIYSVDGAPVPLKVLNGALGYINVLDAVGCWGLVQELSAVTGRVAACSFKHTSPAGAAVYVPWEQLDEPVRVLLGKLYGMEKRWNPTNEGLNAYMRARNGDPMSSFGDFIGVSCEVNLELALFIVAQISDGIVAPSYTHEALDVLKQKKDGNYVIVQSIQQQQKQTHLLEFREIGGLALSQPANTRVITASDLKCVTAQLPPEPLQVENTPPEPLPASAVLDLLVANACLKYAQSNNVACVYQAQLVGLSAGQQSRVHSTRLACAKADVWKRRHHPAAIAMLDNFKPEVRAQSRINATTALAEDPKRFLVEYGELLLSSPVESLKKIDLTENPFKPALSMASDAFFPFPDNIHAAHHSGVAYISQPGGSNRDDIVTEACTAHGIQMVHTNVRIFTH